MSRINKVIIAEILLLGMQAAWVRAEAGSTGEPAKRVLWSDSTLTVDNSPANQKSRGEWEETVYPLGNGRLGGTVFGDIRDHVPVVEPSVRPAK